MYCSVDDLNKLLPAEALLQLCDDEGGGLLDSSEVQGRLQEAIDQADREIDAYLSACRSVPLSPVPPLVANISGVLAVCGLYRRRTHAELPEGWARERERCLKLLERIAEGRLRLGVEEDGTAAEPEPPGVEVSAPARIFGDNTWSRF